MIFPTTGQSVHAVQIKFPGAPQIPKLVRTDSEKKLLVTDVEPTEQGTKVKFVHKGIHLVMYENSKTTEDEIKDSIKDLKKPTGTSVDGLVHRKHQSGLNHAPQIHVHDSNEIMPDFISKLTVGKYSPERVAPEMFGRGFTDSYVTNDSVMRSPSRVSSPHVPTRSHNPSPTDGLLLDQYLKIESYARKDFENNHDSEMDGVRPGSNGSGLRKESPKRVEVPMLSFGDSSKAFNNTHSSSYTGGYTGGYPIASFSPPKSDVSVSSKENAPMDNLKLCDSEENSAAIEHPAITFFDDSAPASAAIGAQRPLPLPLSIVITDHDGIAQLNIPKIDEVPAENSRVATPGQESTQESINLAGQSPTQPFSGRSLSSDICQDLSLSEHQSVEGAVPAYVLRAQTPKQAQKQPPKSPGPISSVVVKAKANQVSSPNRDAEEGRDVFDLDFGHTERSLGQESTVSALSDSVAKNSARTPTNMTRAVLLREQMTKSNVARMESLAKKNGEKTMYTSKTLAGGINAVGAQDSVESGQQKKRFLQAARLVVAFRGDQLKAKNVIHKDKDGQVVKAAQPAFAITSQPLNLSTDLPASTALRTPHALQQQLEKLASNSHLADVIPEGDGVEVSKPPLGRQNTMLSVLTDGFDDSPDVSLVSSPAHPAALQAQNEQYLQSLGTGRIQTGRNTGRNTDRRDMARARSNSEDKLQGGSRKQSLFDFKPPDDVVVPSRNKASKFIDKLKQRVGKDKAQLVEQLVEELDDSSVVSSYFDKNAAPIFVEREKAEKHVLVSKRFEKTEVKEYKPKYTHKEDGDFYASDSEGSYDGFEASGSRRASKQTGGGGGGGIEEMVLVGPDGQAMSRNDERIERIEVNEAGEEIAWMKGPNGESICMRLGSAPSRHTKGSRSEKIRKLKPQFDVEKFVDSVSNEEKAWMDGLDQATVNKIIEAMNALIAPGKKGLQANKKNLAYFRNLIEKYQLEKIEMAKLNMDMQIELVESTDSSLSLSVTSLHGGNCIIILMSEVSSSNRPHTMMTVTAVNELPGLVGYECCVIAPDSFADAVFNNLRPNANYTVFAIADSTRAKLLPLTDEDKAPVQMQVRTLPEQLEIEWSRLSTEMQAVEIKAALRTSWLREAAAVHYPPVQLPADDDIHLEDSSTETGKSAEDKNRAVQKGNLTANRSQKKILTYAEEEQKRNTWRTFLNWWVGQNPLMATKIRAEFLLKEALFAGQQSSILKLYVESGLATAAEAEALPKMCLSIDLLLIPGKTRKENIPTPAALRKFRSWYKGGQVLRDALEKRTGNEDLDAAARAEHVASELHACLEHRTQFLQSRIDEVEACKDIVRQLVASHAYALQNSLVEEDLLFKRSSLEPEDLIAIMSSKRLLQLCIDCGLTTQEKGLAELPVESFGSTAKNNYTIISKADLFKIAVLRNIRPDDPPPVIMTTMPGTTRKPLKAWQLCNRNEKMLEVALACSLDVILKLAAADKVPVPNPEDIAQKGGKFITRDRRLSKFLQWYAGEEETDRIPGHAPPTLQRVVFAETWETDAVKMDPYVVQILADHEYPVPEQFMGLSHADRSIKHQNPSAGKADFFAPLLDLYETTISKLSGTFVRVGLMSRHLTAILECRRISVLRWVMPPGAARVGRQFLFPRMGLLTPAFDLPPPRIKPFPSRRPDAYTHQEMVNWYSSADLDEDDLLMKNGEVEGVRLRSYHNWLAQEKERQDEGRKQMLQEDLDCHLRREINKEVEFRLSENARKLKSIAERSRADEPDKDIDLKFTHSLPSEYWYIFEESQEFKYGSGIHNEDEMEEYREAERQRARDAEIEAEKFENYLQEEITRREQEEQARQKREEQDRRLAEGVARRRRLREHLEELKRQKIVRAEEAEKAKIDAERRRVEEVAVADYFRRKEREKEQEIARTLREQQQMYAEDVLVTDNRARFWEVKRMEHEDIRSFMREKHDAREKEMLKEKVQALKELYKPFNPFPEELATDHMHSLKNLLQNEPPSVAQIYQEVMDTLSQSSKQLSHIDQLTESVDRKRSTRYIRIYEGMEGLPDPTDDSTALSLPIPHHESSAASRMEEIEEGEEAEEAPSRGLAWLRKAQHAPVIRELTHNPTKHAIRTHAHVHPNPYDATWNLVQSNSAPCFVRTTGESFRPTAEPLPTMRTLHTLGPILRPLQDTSLFEVTDAPRISSTPKTRQPSSPSRSVTAAPRNESEILRKFGAPHPEVPVIAQQDEKSSVLIITDSFDDSAALDSRSNSLLMYDGMNGTPLGNRLPFQPPDPSKPADLRQISTISEHHFSQTMPLTAGSANLPAERSLENLTHNASFNSSVFRSTTSAASQAGANKDSPQKGSRKKLKNLLSTSADMMAKTDQKEWLQFLQTQRKATFASLATMDAKAAAMKSRFDQTHAQVAASASEKLLSSQQRPVTPGTLSEIRSKTIQVAQLKKEMQELGIVDESILDFKTRQMAKSASESVLRMQSERAMLRQYVSSGAVLRDEYYLMAVEPNKRHTSSLEVSAEVKKFAEEITRHVANGDDQEKELNFPSITSTEALARPEPSMSKQKPRPKSREFRETPKASLKFGIYEPPNLFLEQSDPVPVRPPDVALNLGVKQLSRAGLSALGVIPTGTTTSTSAGIPRKAAKKTSRSTQRDTPLVGFQSLHTLSTISGAEQLAPNPLGVIRGNPVLVSAATKDASSARRKASLRSLSGTGSLQQATMVSSSQSEVGKRDGSALSKSVELFINTPTPRRAPQPFGHGRDLEEESVDSGFEDHLKQNSAAQFGQRSILSADSASIVLD